VEQITELAHIRPTGTAASIQKWARIAFQDRTTGAGVKLNKKVGKVPCERCGRWDHIRLCKSCPQSKDYPPDHDVLYKEWETDKSSKARSQISTVKRVDVNKIQLRPRTSKIWIGEEYAYVLVKRTEE
jgi:hypothetical protein